MKNREIFNKLTELKVKIVDDVIHVNDAKSSRRLRNLSTVLCQVLEKIDFDTEFNDNDIALLESLDRAISIVYDDL